MKFKETLTRYLDAGFPIIYINAFEESKIEETIKSIADRRTIATWSMAAGYGEFSTKSNEWVTPPTKDESTRLETVLNTKLVFESELHRTILVVKDAHIVLEDERIRMLLKEIAIKISVGLDCSIILISSVLKIPVELEKYITILNADYLCFDDICGLVKTFVEENGLAELQPRLLEEMATAFKGLSEFEINNILALAVADDGELNRKDLSLIFEQKKQMILKSGIMEMIPVKESIDDIGGLENLKRWLKRKAKVIKNIQSAEKFGVDMPKGVLIAGVPGCGKSLSAKAAASLFEVPILRLDVGKLMGKYLGESEANLRKVVLYNKT